MSGLKKGARRLQALQHDTVQKQAGSQNKQPKGEAVQDLQVIGSDSESPPRWPAMSTATGSTGTLTLLETAPFLLEAQPLSGPGESGEIMS